MPPEEDIIELEKQLDPAARVLVSMMRQAFKDQRAQLEAQRTQLEKLQRQLEELQQQLSSAHAKRDDLEAQNAELKRMLFGRNSEKMPPIDNEVRRAIEAEEYFGDDSSSKISDDQDEEVRKKQRRKKGRKKSEKERQKRRLAKKKLPVIHEKVEVTAGQIPEGYTLDDFRSVGHGEVVCRIDHVKEHLVVVEYELQRLASKDGEHIISAEAPVAVSEGGHYGPGVYAFSIVSKCDDSLPLYRIEKGLARDGFSIPRSTLCGLFHRAAELLAPISTRLVEIACQDKYLSADETTMPVQQKGGCRTGWFWTFITTQTIAYIFSETRGGQIPEGLLDKTTGYLQVDGYKGYDSSCKKGSRIRVGCWAHCRRGFFKALKSAPDEARKVLDMIVELYRVEYKAAELEVLGTEAHLELRRLHSKKILKRLKTYLTKEQPKHLPKSPMGKAITYAQNQWKTLKVFTTDAKLRLDNNLSENALRIMAFGRKNLMFVGHDVAGKNLATLQTVVATCKLHGVNPYDYIRDVLIRIQTHKVSELDALLPFNWKPPPAQDQHAPS